MFLPVTGVNVKAQNRRNVPGNRVIKRNKCRDKGTLCLCVWPDNYFIAPGKDMFKTRRGVMVKFTRPG